MRSAPSLHALVDMHFAGQTSRQDDARMWLHLQRCAECQERYRRQALLEHLDPRGPAAASERLGRALFGAAARRRPRSMIAGAALVLAAAAALFVAFAPALDDGFRARGPARPAASALRSPVLRAFRVGDDGHAVPLGSVMHPREALTFSYRNREQAPFAYLMVFALADEGRVLWFAPRWSDARDNPTSTAIAGGPNERELGAAVRHDFGKGAVQIVGFFSERPYSVREVERWLSDGIDALEKRGALHVITVQLEETP